MPKESVLYVKLQNLDEVYGEIEVSANWEKALALLSDASDWAGDAAGALYVSRDARGLTCWVS